MLIHDALTDYIIGDTSVVAYQLRMAIHDLDKEDNGQSGFERQFEVRTYIIATCYNIHNVCLNNMMLTCYKCMCI